MSTDFAISDTLVGERLDRVVALVCGCSRAEAARLIDREKVAVNGQRLRVGLSVWLLGDHSLCQRAGLSRRSGSRSIGGVDVVHADEH